MLRGARPLGRAAHGLAFSTRLPPPRQFSGLLMTPTPSIRATTTSLVPRILPLLLRSPFSTKPPAPPGSRDVKLEKKLAEETLEANPAEVSTKSSIPGYVEGENAPADTSNKAGSELLSDIDTVKDTFALNNVPRQPFALGLAGTLPYLGTSISTVYLSWVINTELTQSTFVNSFLVTKDTALHWLHLLEPIQVGYGAVIISFLGAIHWGLEYAEKEPSARRTRFRYGMGVTAPILAWPTVFMPVEWALITQFLSFTGLYLADLRATTRGWTPPWYSNYRFVLTAVVGAAIFVSLVGRAKVGKGHTRLSTSDLRARMHPDEDKVMHNWEQEEKKEKERIRKKKAEEEKKKREEEEKEKEKEKEKKKPTDKKPKDDKEKDEKKQGEEEGNEGAKKKD